MIYISYLHLIFMRRLRKISFKNRFREGWKYWKIEFSKHSWLIFASLLLVLVAAFFDYYSGVYVTSINGSSVPDLILDHIGPYDLTYLYSYGYLIVMSLFFFYPLLFHITQLHKFLTQFSLLVSLRSFFMILTHLENPINAVHVSFPWIFQTLAFQNDLFFSGHTAIPFLGFLLIKTKFRYFFLISSIIMGSCVLLMHRHYSIDVFAAFFITYGSYKIGEFFLKKYDEKKDY